MAKILLKGSFNEEGYRGAVAEPADRETAARQLFTKAGLQVESFYFSPTAGCQFVIMEGDVTQLAAAEFAFMSSISCSWVKYPHVGQPIMMTRFARSFNAGSCDSFTDHVEPRLNLTWWNPGRRQDFLRSTVSLTHLRSYFLSILLPNFQESDSPQAFWTPFLALGACGWLRL